MREENSDQNELTNLKRLVQIINNRNSNYHEIINTFSILENKYKIKLRDDVAQHLYEKSDYIDISQHFRNEFKWDLNTSNYSFSDFKDVSQLMFSKETNHHEFIDASKYYERSFDFVNSNFWQDLQSSDIENGKKSLIESVYDLLPYEGLPAENKIILLEESERVKRIIRDIYDKNERIYTIQPEEFEDLVAELLRAQNFETEITKRTRDGGYDIIAVQSIGDFPLRFLIECKRFAAKRKVGVNIVRGFRDVVNTEGANKGIIVTSSYFSPDAEDYRSRHSPHCLDFKDHDDVIAWVNKYVKN